MKKYVALLRGINVGGNNKVSMPELKELFEKNGFDNVMTYINSGNVIFSSDIAKEDEIKHLCESIIAEKFKLKIPIAIVSIDDLKLALDHAPKWWNADENSKHNAIFVIPPVSVEEVFKEVGAIKPEYEKVGYYNRVIFWSAPVKTFSKTRWSKVAGSSVYDSITIRNANTVHKILQLKGVLE